MIPSVSEYHFSPRRALGRTGFVATALGIGDLADRNVPAEDSIATLRRAMDAGLNVIDTAPQYENGYSEQIVGQALKGRRDGMFLIDKIDFFDQPVRPQVEGSLDRLGLDMVDAFLFHGCSTMEDWNRIAAPGGLMDQLGDMVRKGFARFRGISSHHPDVVRAAIESDTCDLVMFAVGPFVDPRYIQEILPLAHRNQVGTIGIKTFGAGKLMGETSGYGRPLQERPRGKFSSGGSDLTADGPAMPCMSAAECVQYTLTCDPDVALLGMSFPNEQDAAFAAAATFKPLSPDQMAVVRRNAVQAVENKGPCWWNPQ